MAQAQGHSTLLNSVCVWCCRTALHCTALHCTAPHCTVPLFPPHHHTTTTYTRHLVGDDGVGKDDEAKAAGAPCVLVIAHERLLHGAVVLKVGTQLLVCTGARAGTEEGGRERGAVRGRCFGTRGSQPFLSCWAPPTFEAAARVLARARQQQPTRSAAQRSPVVSQLSPPMNTLPSCRLPMAVDVAVAVAGSTAPLVACSPGRGRRLTGGGGDC